MIKLNYRLLFCNILWICCLLITQTNGHKDARLLELDRVLFENCTVHDLRNIREYHQEPNQIIITHCSISDLPNALFLRFCDLTEYLEISDSKLQKIQDYALNGLQNLQTLNVCRNNLTELKSSWSNTDLLQLHTLDGRRNHIQTIGKTSLQRYPNLLKLNVAVNNINQIDVDAFKWIPMVKTINLGKNELKQISDGLFKSLTKLQHLSLHNNRIETIDTFAFATNLHLKTLRLDGNQLKLFDGILMDNLSRLIYLNLSHNQLNHLSERTFHKNLELKILDLSYNYFVTFEKNTFTGLQMLEVFNTSHNSIELLYPLTLRELNNLKLFDVSNNNLTYLFDGLFEYVPELEHLNLSGNAIDEIQSNVFNDLTYLNTLDLSNNRLTNVDNFLQNQFNSLKTLNISNNKIEHINLTNLYQFNLIELYENHLLCSFILNGILMMATTNDGGGGERTTQINFGKNYKLHSSSSSSSLSELSETSNSLIGHSIPSGINCIDDENKMIVRNILVLDIMNNKNYHSTDEIVIEETHNNILLDETVTNSKTTYDTFDYRSCLIWTAIGIVVVYGIVQIGKVLSKKSERQSEQYRISQQDRMLQEIDQYFSRKYSDDKKLKFPLV